MRHQTFTVSAVATVMLIMLTPYSIIQLVAPVHAASPDFVVASNPTELDIPQGSSSTSKITVTSLYNYTGTVSLITSQPSGITTTLNPSSLTPPKNSVASSTLNIAVLASATPGNYMIVITGNDGTTSRTATVIVQVVTPSFTVAASTATISLIPGKIGSATITIISNGYTGKVSLQAQVSPSGPTATPATPSINLSSGVNQNQTLTVTTTPTTSPGNYTITFTGNATGPNGPLTSSVSIALKVNSGPSTSPLFSPVVIGGLATAIVMISLTMAVWRRRPPRQ